MQAGVRIVETIGRLEGELDVIVFLDGCVQRLQCLELKIVVAQARLLRLRLKQPDEMGDGLGDLVQLHGTVLRLLWHSPMGRSTNGMGNGMGYAGKAA